MSALVAEKAAARTAAFARRKAAFETGEPLAGARRLLEVLAPHAGRDIAGYMAMRTEIDPGFAMAELSRAGRVCVPVIEGKGLPLAFRRWTPASEMIEGAFGARIPAVGEAVVPEILIVPLVAFDRRGGRLGYGGGFYDRTLEGLRALRPVLAVGFAWAAQEAAELPLEPTDQPLDMVVTDAEVIAFG